MSAWLSSLCARTGPVENKGLRGIPIIPEGDPDAQDPLTSWRPHPQYHHAGRQVSIRELGRGARSLTLLPGVRKDNSDWLGGARSRRDPTGGGLSGSSLIGLL